MGYLFDGHVASDDEKNEFVFHFWSDPGVFSIAQSPLIMALGGGGLARILFFLVLIVGISIDIVRIHQYSGGKTLL